MDCVLFGAIDAVAKTGVSYLVLEHFYDGYYVKNWLRSPIGIALALKGFKLRKLLDHAVVRLVTTLPELDPGTRQRQPANVVYAGPVVTGVPAQPSAPTVLVSLSTFNFPGQTRVMQNILDALGELSAQAIVTTGPVIDACDLTVPSNVELHSFIPHGEVMPDVSLVVGHGGHATTMQALAHDLPLLILPMHPMLDQKMVGRSVESAGAGRALRKYAKPAQITATMRELLSDSNCRQAAARLGGEIRESQGAQNGADFAERFCQPRDRSA